ncbi:MAG: hypothetical protein J6I49_02300 [Bacteroidales bacterium]|nr:hypothetical protein [Bacteroidales bacterium]
MKIRLMTCLTAVVLTLAACGGDEDFVAPSFLHVDAMTLTRSNTNPLDPDPGLYSAEIVSCYVEALYKDSRKVETLGLFELPFTIPVLYSGEVEYLVFHPAIKISGVSGMQTHYTFYNSDTLRNVSLQSGDTLRLDTLRTTYRIKSSNVLMFESFEPTRATIFFDSVEWRKHERDSTLWGEGYGLVSVPDTETYVPFAINQSHTITTARGSSIVYLELDHRSDLPFEVYMQSQYMSNSSTDVQRVMVVNPSKTWQHMYINLGRTWEWFGYYPTFRLIFRALNIDGTGGSVRLDNVRVVTTTQTL